MKYNYYESRGMGTILPRRELVDRRVYRIQSRNLSVGAWCESTGGFIGIREKFGSEYLFTEYFADGVSLVGTANPRKDLGITVPDDVPMTERLLDDAGRFVLTAGGFTQTNTELFELLQPLNEAARKDYAAWWREPVSETTERGEK